MPTSQIVNPIQPVSSLKGPIFDTTYIDEHNFRTRFRMLRDMGVE